MYLKLYNLPFLIVLIALPINWIINFTGIGILIWSPELITIVLVLYLVFLQKKKG